ncbi:MAG TPA: serine/threonine-protein kinase [Polyangiaceae bacterium LLY-WYZ-15_(1-7)]|nr:serine/threonine-protein kinase [Polyangiaceae bacterium LLY-WYZ-15_(1-7)]HJL05156.1 serine/threonine-protein kinase [Polyangiaceae bacterium LLY-WYZ-15_(1-7)]HJL13007.1 serine/threonine-protein kinase [Polyangiaceae bacterium LLY-WYZ-15_(1-7)]HJL21644.1 serine/threonine-protein kinase [Polyangiaceae bacterium LLY-WYZ-15_(1-7)]HJL34447.1 serine/threonine-protein kinase [Polyangiaceae bacterium LLY-WYZ-15_(1-7)]
MAENYVGREVAGQFRIVQRIGSGGMGAVYKAEQPDMNRHVAIKILHPRYLSRSDLVSRFRREARAMSHLSHPHTARVFLYGQLEDGACYFVMEYLEGRNLAQIVRAEGPMEPARAIQIMSKVCGALDEAHQAGIIHRDLKPENIFLTVQGGIEDFPKVLDFGLAKVTEKQMKPGSMILTREGMVFGTPEFMSPEQARGKTLDARSDIYSLGVIMYELLTGKLPFDARQPIEYIQLHVNAQPIPLSERAPERQFPPGLEEAVMRALAKDPDHRYASAAAFGEALEAVGRGAVAAPQQAPQAQQPLSQPIFTGPGRGAPQAAGQPSPQPTPPAQQPMPQGQQPAPRVPSQQPAPAPSKLPWVVFGAGVLLAIGGAVALIVALTR